MIFDSQERIQKANAYVSAIHDLPPTYKIGEEIGFKQIVCDPVTREEIGFKLEAVNKAERELHDYAKKNGY